MPMVSTCSLFTQPSCSFAFIYLTASLILVIYLVACLIFISSPTDIFSRPDIFDLAT